MSDIGSLSLVCPQVRPVIDWFYKLNQNCPSTFCRQEENVGSGFYCWLVSQSHHWESSLVRPVKAPYHPLIRVLDRVTLGGARKFSLHLVSTRPINCFFIPVIYPHSLSWLFTSQPDPFLLPIYPQNLFCFPFPKRTVHTP